MSTPNCIKHSALKSFTKEELFVNAMKLKNLELNSETINVACTYLLKVKDKNYLEVRVDNTQSKGQKPQLPYHVIVYERNNKEVARFKTLDEAKNFLDTLTFINKISGKQ